jgi:2-polyprenyl-3-methyl-5-hydroxy-6-metoxy-1,4-benzoquinol methylase
MNTDREWEAWGTKDAYFAVVSRPEFRKDVLDKEGLEDFFQSGETHIADILETLHRLNPAFRPSNVLDYGCGVGRLVLPLARRFDRVTGIDISPSMLAEAAKNTSGHTNISLIHASELDSLPSHSFDFIHSFIVFQHIPVKKGEQIFRKLLDLLRPGGMGALHFTIARNHALLSSFLDGLRHVPLIQAADNIVHRRPISDPPIQMNEYQLNHLFSMLAREGCGPVLSEFTQHAQFAGVILYFEKR